MVPVKLNESSNSEMSTLYSQANHYANRMVSLLIPTDISSSIKVQKVDHHLEHDTNVSNSIVESKQYCWNKHSNSEHHLHNINMEDDSDDNVRSLIERR